MHEITLDDYKHMFRSIDSAVVVLTPDLTVVEATDKYLEASQTNREQLIGQNLFKATPPNTAVGNTIDSFERVKLLKVPDVLPVNKYEVPRPEEEGGGYLEKYCSSTCYPVFNDSGEIIYLMSSVVDVTNFINLQKSGENKEILDEELGLYVDDRKTEVLSRISDRQKILQQLTEAKALAEKSASEYELASKAKSSFISTMSHEIRTPLNGIIGMTELLSLSDHNIEHREYLGIIRECSDSLLYTVNDILDFSKIESDNLVIESVPFNLPNFIEGITESVAMHAHAKHIALAALLDPKLPVHVIGDQLRLGQVLKNLLSNAIKFTNTGEISLIVKVDSFFTKNNHDVPITFEVHDSGIGMNQEEISQLFKPFTQSDISTSSKHEYLNTGLRLTISQRIVNLMGGVINVHSIPDKGSTFCFTVKFLHADTNSNADTEATNIKLKKARILIVDDNKINRIVLRTQLKSWDLDCDEAASGQEALTMLIDGVNTNKPYSIALVDCMMPEMDGVELSKHIVGDKRLYATDIVMLTSIGLSISVEEFKRIGISQWITKPIRRTKLYNAIITVLKKQDGIHAINRRRKDIKTKLNISKHPKEKQLILLVEDNATNQEVLARMLKYLKYDCIKASSIVEAIEKLKKRDIDLILMSCHMSEMDGFEATKLIRELEINDCRNSIPILGICEKPLLDKHKTCNELGMDDYITKPVNIINLKKILNIYLIQSDIQTTQTQNEFELEKIKLIFKDDREGMHAFIQIFIDNTRKTLKDMDNAISQQDFISAKIIAHLLQGSCKGLGSSTVHDLSIKLNHAINKQDVVQAKIIIASFEEAVERLKQKI